MRKFNPIRSGAIVLCAVFFVAFTAAIAPAQCPSEPPLLNYNGVGQVVCPCFIPGEQAGVILNAPPAHYPLEILRIGIGWGSLFNANPAQVEQALHVYPDSLPDPGVPIFTLLGPQFNDGFINEFNIEPLLGEVNVNSGPFTVTVEFLNQSAGDQFASSVVHDGNGCQAGANVVKALPGGWFDACVLGVTGDWVMYVVYRPCVATGISGTFVSSTAPALITRTHPNPFAASTEVEFILDAPGHAEVRVYDVRGRLVSTLTDREYGSGVHQVGWNGLDQNGTSAPSGVYFVRLEAAGTQSVRKVLLTK